MDARFKILFVLLVIIILLLTALLSSFCYILLHFIRRRSEKCGMTKEHEQKQHHEVRCVDGRNTLELCASTIYEDIPDITFTHMDEYIDDFAVPNDDEPFYFDLECGCSGACNCHIEVAWRNADGHF